MPPDREVSTRQPKCSRCRNHQRDVLLRGHKNYCPYRSCNCRECGLTLLRQKVMAAQVALRRRQKLEQERALSNNNHSNNNFGDGLSKENDAVTKSFLGGASLTEQMYLPGADMLAPPVSLCDHLKAVDKGTAPCPPRTWYPGKPCLPEALPLPSSAYTVEPRLTEGVKTCPQCGATTIRTERCPFCGFGPG